MPKRIASGATAALVWAIIGLFIFGLILGFVAMWLSRKAKKLIAENPELGGSGRATAAFVIGIIDVVGWAIGLMLL